MGGTYGFRGELATKQHELRRLAPIAVIGALAGAALLLTTSARIFDDIVPFLVLFASVLLLLQPRIQRWVLDQPHDGFARSHTALAASTFVVSAYGAYFGGGLGVILIAVLGIFMTHSLLETNALKSALSLLINLVALVIFALFGPVQWTAVAIMAPMSLIGGWAGAHVSRRIPATALRPVIVTFGIGVAILLMLR